MDLMCMSPRLRYSQRLLKQQMRHRRSLHGIAAPANEYSEVPNYPEVEVKLDERTRNMQNLIKTYKSLKTVEERNFYLNQPKYYGWYSCQIDPDSQPFNSLNLAQYVTWTNVVPTSEGLPPQYDELEEEASKICAQIYDYMDQSMCSDLQSILVSCQMPPEDGKGTLHSHRDYGLHSYNQISNFVQFLERQLSRSLTGHCVGHVDEQGLSTDNNYDHLNDGRIRTECRNEAFWFRGGFHPDRSMIKKRKGRREIGRKTPQVNFLTSTRLDQIRDVSDDLIYGKYDRVFQFKSRNFVQSNSKHMIPPFVDIGAKICNSAESIPQYRFDPRNLGYKMDCKLGFNTPGHWNHTTSHPFTHVQFASARRVASLDELRAATAHNEKFGAKTRSDCLTAASIFTSFAQCHAQAVELGSGPFIDPETPLTMQTVLTDGVRMKLAVYQLNKTALHPDFDDINPDYYSTVIGGAKLRNNVMWHTPEFDIFQTASSKSNLNSTIKLNPQLLKNLIKFYLMKPSLSREQVQTLSLVAEERKETASSFSFPASTPQEYRKRVTKNVQSLLDHEGDYAAKPPAAVGSIAQVTTNHFNRQYFHDLVRLMTSGKPPVHPKPDIQTYEKLYYIDRQYKGFVAPNREQRWWHMAKVDFLGKHHWHPEFRHLDYFQPAYVPKKFRPGWKEMVRVRKSVPPLYHDQPNNPKDLYRPYHMVNY